MLRLPAVAGRFYPGDAASLRRTVASLVPNAVSPGPAIAVVSPHAGYVYSGAVAGETLSSVVIPEDVIILGPNHHGRGAPVALMAHGAWQLPTGQVPVAEDLARLLLPSSLHIEEDTTAHLHEHSLEVQVPFLQYLQPNLRIAPIVVSALRFDVCREVGMAIARAVREYGKPVLLVASSDMTHYESRRAASAKDHRAIDRILAMDPQGLYDTVVGERISMCGIMPTTIALVAAMELGAREAKLVRYTDSGETSGDTDQVVGYAGLVLA